MQLSAQSLYYSAVFVDREIQNMIYCYQFIIRLSEKLRMSIIFLAPWKNDDSEIQIRFTTFDSSAEYWTSELHWHEYFEIEFYVKGSATNIINGQPYTVSKGSLAFLSPNDFHKLIKADGELLIHKLTFLPSSLSQKAVNALGQISCPFVQGYCGKGFISLAEKFERLSEAFNMADKNTSLGLLRIQTCAESILIHLFENFAKSSPIVSPLRPADPVLNGIRYINEHLCENIRVSDIAASVFLSEDYFSHIFKKYTSISISEYILEQRMKRAYYMLHDTDMPIGKIAASVGYNSASLFYRHFRRCFDGSPNEIRNITKNE